MPLPATDIVKQASAAKARAKDLADALDRLANARTDTDLIARWANLKPVSDQLDDLLDGFPALFGEAATSSFSNFLAEVGEAAVDAQRRLDHANRDLVREALAQRLPPSGIFQLPKVSGEVKFALTQKAGKKMNLIFHSKDTSSEQRNEQTLNFDIVSVPPPPELLRQVNENISGANPVFAPSTRQPVLHALIAPTRYLVRDGAELPGYTEPATFVAPDPDGALVFRVPRSATDPTDPQRYIVLWAAADDVPNNNDRVGIWEVDLGAANGPVARIIWQIGSSGLPKNEDIAPLRAWIRLLATQQAALRHAVNA